MITILHEIIRDNFINFMSETANLLSIKLQTKVLLFYLGYIWFNKLKLKVWT